MPREASLVRNEKRIKPVSSSKAASSDRKYSSTTPCTRLEHSFVKHRSTSKRDARNFGARGVYKRDLLRRAASASDANLRREAV